jgi:hypothetical protein
MATQRGLRVRGALAFAAVAFCGSAGAQQPDLSGMWSDPPSTVLDTFCLFWCSDVGLGRLEALLDDPANDTRPTVELLGEAAGYQLEQYVRPRLTPAALESMNLDPADDPSFLECVPWPFAREIFAPHQLKLAQLRDRVEMQYGEWNTRRTVYLDGRAAPAAPGPMGHSIGRYEGGALVVETSGVPAGLAPWGAGFPIPLFPFDGKHSDQLRVRETYTRSADGERLLMTATLEDPWALREPLELKKVWAWAPDQAISPYENCEKPDEFTRGTEKP